MATIVRYLTFATVMTGCTFASPAPEIIPPAPAPTPQPCRAGEEGVVLCVDFEDDSLAAQALDHSRYQNHAVAHDVDSTRREPPGERAAVLSAVSSLRVPESPTLDLAAFTIEMWIRPDRKPPKRKDAGLFDNPGEYTMRIKDDLKIRCGVSAAAGAPVTSDGAVPEREWSHVACRYDGAELRVYINGQLSRCQSATKVPIPSGLGSAIGAELAPIAPIAPENLVDRFLGGVDNVRIYDRPLADDLLCEAAGHPRGSCQSECP